MKSTNDSLSKTLFQQTQLIHSQAQLIHSSEHGLNTPQNDSSHLETARLFPLSARVAELYHTTATYEKENKKKKKKCNENGAEGLRYLRSTSLFLLQLSFLQEKFPETFLSLTLFCLETLHKFL